MVLLWQLASALQVLRKSDEQEEVHSDSDYKPKSSKTRMVGSEASIADVIDENAADYKPHNIEERENSFKRRSKRAMREVSLII